MDSFSNPRANYAGLSFLVIMLSCLAGPSVADFYRDTEFTWGGGNGKILDGGRGLSLALDQHSGSGFQSKNDYLFGRFDMQIKLVPGNSAGTVTTFYLSSQGAGHDEIDFEFLGNASGQPYTLHTNVYSEGKGDKEQQFRLWFDPTSAFHTYSIVWSPHRIIFLVDNSPMRVFNNHESIGVAFPNTRPMRVYGTIWNAEGWATQGGRVKTDWTQAPFVANYRDFKMDTQTQDQGLDAKGRNRLKWVQAKQMVYNYCADAPRFPQGPPVECKLSRF